MPIETMQDVLNVVLHEESVPERDRNTMASAIRRVCEIRRTKPERVAANISVLREMTTNPPPHHVMKPGSWSNLKSRLKKALWFCGIGDHRKRLFQDLSPGWQDLRSRTRDLGYQARLSALSHYCSDREIDPAEVDQEVFEAFEAYLLETRIRKNPEKAYSLSVKAWNDAVIDDSGWPQVTIQREARTNWFSLPLSAYCASFQNDFEAKFERARTWDPLDLSTPCKPRRESTIESLEGNVLRFAAACVNSGTKIEDLNRLTDLLEPERFRFGLRWLLFDRHGWTKDQPVPSSLIENAGSLRRNGRHWLRHDIEDLEGDERDTALRRIDDQVATLKEITGALGGRDSGITEKNRDALRQFDDIKSLITFIHLPEIMFKRSRRAKSPTRDDALLMQSAIAIRILQEDPIRLANLVSLNWETNFVASTPRKGAPVRLKLSKRETKNRVDHDDPIPADLIEWIEVYMNSYQPLLAGNSTAYLFPGREGGTKHPHSLREQIQNTLKREAGLSLTPHQYRHLSVKISLMFNPKDRDAPTDFLRHKDKNTVRLAYRELDQAGALVEFQSHLERLRPKSRRRPSRTGP